MSKEEKAIELGDILLQNLLKQNEALKKEIAELKAANFIRNDYIQKISFLEKQLSEYEEKELKDSEYKIRLALEREVD